MGKRQNELELYELNKLKNSNSSFDIKANYINSKLTKKAEKVDIKSHKFLMEIDNLIDVKIDNKDKDSRALIGDTYLKIYGREDSSDKKNRPLTIEKIRERFIKRKIPLKVIEEQSYFILTKSEKM